MPWLNMAVAAFMHTLFTGLTWAAVIVFLLRFLRVRSVIFKCEIESRDHEHHG